MTIPIPVPHDGHGRALVGAGEAQHVTHRVKPLDVLQIVLANCAQRITRQEGSSRR